MKASAKRKAEPSAKRARGYGVRFVPTKEQRELVEFMAAVGIPQDQIARLVKHPATGNGIDPKTLRSAFRDEITDGATKATVMVLKNLYAMAVGTGPQAATCAIFWAKTRAKWSERLEIVGADGGAIKHDHTHHDLTKYSDADLDKAYADQVRASAGAQRMPPGTTH